jgi:putative NADH-flavin reductase
MPHKKILVLGATGRTGSSLIEQADAAGYEVTAVVRDPDRLPPVSRAVRIVRGDLLSDSNLLETAVPGQDAVISALGVGQSFRSRRLISQSAPVIVAAMLRHGVHRLVFTSAFGVGATYNDTPLLPRLLIATLLRDIYADKEAGEQVILRSDLDWTIVYPVGLTDGPLTGQYRVAEHLDLRGFPHISRADVANLLLRQVEDISYVRKGVLVAPLPGSSH